jgi:hypothetical protein
VATNKDQLHFVFQLHWNTPAHLNSHELTFMSWIRFSQTKGEIMRKPIVVLSAMLIGAVLATGVAYTSLRADSLGESKGAVTLPGDWSLACLPTLKPQPLVDAYSVTTNALKGLTITQVGVKNLSAKNAIGIKLGWRLFLEGDPQTSLKQGITPLLGVPLSPGERRVVEFPVVKAANVLATVTNNGSLRGKFRIEVAVVDVLF